MIWKIPFMGVIDFFFNQKEKYQFFFFKQRIWLILLWSKVTRSLQPAPGWRTTDSHSLTLESLKRHLPKLGLNVSPFQTMGNSRVSALLTLFRMQFVKHETIKLNLHNCCWQAQEQLFGDRHCITSDCKIFRMTYRILVFVFFIIQQS